MATAQNKFHLLVIDDDNILIDSLKHSLPDNWSLHSMSNEQNLNQRIMYHAAFVDMHLTNDLSKAEGPQIIQKICRDNPQVEVVGMSGDLSLDLMESCLKAGARRFLGKPLLQDEVTLVLEKIEAIWQMRQLETQSKGLMRWVGSSKISQKLKDQIAALRGENGPILIEGESGTGKEVACRIINQQEPGRPLISVNIAGIPENLFESELYGHVKGAFTGADTHKVGLAEAAHGGDLFLDEIEALPLTQQVKLLRFLESGEVRKVGAKESNIIKARVIVASNQNLEELVRQGKFREDLLWRLNGKKLLLPPLRERKEDIKELVQFFLDLEKPKRNKSISDGAIEELKKYNWPGNVRELKRVCEQLALTSPLPVIRTEDIKTLLNYSAEAPGDLKIDLTKSLDAHISSYEALILKKYAEHYKDIDEISKVLGVSRSTLYKKIKDHQIEGI